MPLSKGRKKKKNETSDFLSTVKQHVAHLRRIFVPEFGLSYKTQFDKSKRLFPLLLTLNVKTSPQN